MNQQKRNQSAAELWEQVFSRLAQSDNAAVMQPDYDPAEDEQRLRVGLRESGWPEDFIDQSILVSNERYANAPITSPGVNRAVEAQHNILCEDIETAMERLNFETHLNVARGVEPRLGPLASQINVMMTEESVVTVGAHLFRFCGLIARATTRTIHLNDHIWDSENWTLRDGRNLLLASPKLLTYWMKIFLSYAVSGSNRFVPFQPSQKHESLLFEQIARAMELFAIAHEYGHHHHSHGRNIEADAHREEFEADQFALKVCYEIEKVPVIFENPYLSSGAGGALLLLSLAQLRSIEFKLDGEPEADSKTHPSVLERIRRMDSVAIMKPVEFRSLKNFRTAVVRVMDVVNSLLSESLPKIPLDDYARFRREFRGD